MNYGKETRRASLLIPIVHKLSFAVCSISIYTNTSFFCQRVTCVQWVV